MLTPFYLKVQRNDRTLQSGLHLLQPPSNTSEQWLNEQRFAEGYHEDLVPHATPNQLAHSTNPFETDQVSLYFPSPPPATSSAVYAIDHPIAPRAVLPSTGAPSPAASPKTCSHCQTIDTPLWRRHPASGTLLCNACGLYIQQHACLRPRQLLDSQAAYIDDARDEAATGRSGRTCTHCGATRTSVWRRSKDSRALLCNACGVYARTKGTPRPVRYMQKCLRRRMRYPKVGENTTDP